MDITKIYHYLIMKSIKILGAQLTQQDRCHEIIAWQLKLRSGKKTKCELSKQLSTATTTFSHGWLLSASHLTRQLSRNFFLRQTESLEGEKNRNAKLLKFSFVKIK